MREKIIKLLNEIGIKDKIEITNPPKPEMSDLSFACFDLAKKMGKNPAEVAKELALFFCHPRGNGDPAIGRRLDSPDGHRRNDNLINAVHAVGPYVNFTLNAGAVAKIVLPAITKEKEKYGASRLSAGKKILIEYPSNNTHKEVHVGHLRNICLGNALVKIWGAVGFEILPINYINDFGTHVAKCLWGLLKFHAKEKPPADRQKWLGEIYAEASIYLKEHEEAKPEVVEIQRKLEARDKTIWPLFVKTRKWSLDGFARIFKELGVKHKRVFYEMNVKDLGQKIVDELLRKKIAEVGEGGAIIVDLKKYDLDVALLRKSNGAGLYLTSDLGLARMKNKIYPKVFESVHLTGTEQNFYFKQLFKVLELAGNRSRLTHVGYGLVDTPEGKMSSRAGNVILYQAVRDQAIKLAMAETAKRHPDWPKKKIEKTARGLALGALKFSMVKVGPTSNITFNAQEALSFDGYTGPYLQYSLARINSILRKVQNSKISNIQSASWRTISEKQLLLKLAAFSEVIQPSAQANDPSQLAKYLYELAKLFSDFYEACPVLKAESEELKTARLALVRAVKMVMENGLKILGVPVLKEM